VAVYRALGIGLGFNFDHMRTLKDGEKPSLRRLQARAAKSAVRRLQELYGPQALEKASEERQKMREKRIREDEREVKYIAKRLSNLLPAGPDSEFDHISTSVSMSRIYEKFSDHEHAVNSYIPSIGKNRMVTESHCDDSDDYLLDAFKKYVAQMTRDKDDSSGGDATEILV
jgi:hypothetical protein